nr:uncharacterized protein LOC105846153 [Hydra vulgaris]
MFKEFKKETEEMFQKQEKAVLDIIGANIKIINDRFEKVEKNVDGNANCIKKLTKELEDIKKIDHAETILGLKKFTRMIKNHGGIQKKKSKHSSPKKKLGLKGVEIERAHRTGRKNDGRPRTIILNLQKYKDKIRILKELYRLKGTNTFVNEDFSRETVAIQKKLFAEVKERRLNGESVTVRYDKIVYIKTSFKSNFNE